MKFIDGIECVTFDLDDTLWPVEPVINAAEQQLYQWLATHYPRITNTYSLQELTEQRLELKNQNTTIAHDVTALRFQSLLQLAQEFDYSPKLAEDGMREFRLHRNCVEPYAESESTLSLLAKSFTLGAITNGNAQLQYIEIGRYFDFIVTAEEVGACKPDPRVFEYAVQLAGVPASKVVHVGDCANSDVLGALSAGCKSIWLNAERKAWPGGQNPHAVIHSIGELPQLLTNSLLSD